MKGFYRLIPLLLVMVFAISCATIIKGTSTTVNVSSNPSQAKVQVKLSNGTTINNGTTPATFSLSKKNTYVVVINMEGYQEQQVFIDQKFENWFLGNICIGGIVGMAIDFVTGAMWNLEPSQIHVEMVMASKDGVQQKYAVIGSIDDRGQLRTIAIPMVPVIN